MNFNIGDKVYADDLYEGTIVDIYGEFASVEFSTSSGGGCFRFRIDELKHVPIRIPTLKVIKSPHETLNVMIKNCSSEVATILWRFDLWNSNGDFKIDENKPNEKPEIWFECPIEFLDFIESTMGKECFKRMGVKEFYIEK